MKIKVGLVGAGFAAVYHFACLKNVYSVPIEIVGVTSLRKKSRDTFAKKRSIKAYASFDELLRDVDVIDICTPPYTHADMIIKAANAGKDIIVEKPLTGYFGPKEKKSDFKGNKANKKPMLKSVLKTLERIYNAVNKSKVLLCYAENFVYAPSIQKEKEIIQKSRSQILRMLGEESHNGSHSKVYGDWNFSGGGSLIGKGCHPLSALLYLKRMEGFITPGRPIRPVTVSARVHEITRLPNYKDKGYIRIDYKDVEDYGFMHVSFDDGTVGDVITSEIVLGGTYDYVEVFANNHRARCRLSPTNMLDVYNPNNKELAGIYLMEKLSSAEGWSPVAPNENLTMGYQSEIQDFMECIYSRSEPQSGLELAIDTTTTIYAAYVSSENMGHEESIPTIMPKD